MVLLFEVYWIKGLAVDESGWGLTTLLVYFPRVINTCFLLIAVML